MKLKFLFQRRFLPLPKKSSASLKEKQNWINFKTYYPKTKRKFTEK